MPRDKLVGMPRTARVAPGGIVYHVLNRGNEGRKLFESEGVGTIPLAEGAMFLVQELNAAGRAVDGWELCGHGCAGRSAGKVRGGE